MAKKGFSVFFCFVSFSFLFLFFSCVICGSAVQCFLNTLPTVVCDVWINSKSVKLRRTCSWRIESERPLKYFNARKVQFSAGGRVSEVQLKLQMKQVPFSVKGWSHGIHKTCPCIYESRGPEKIWPVAYFQYEWRLPPREKWSRAFHSGCKGEREGWEGLKHMERGKEALYEGRAIEASHMGSEYTEAAQRCVQGVPRGCR